MSYNRIHAAAGAALLCAAGLAGAALAHPEHDGDKVKKVIVITEHEGEEAKDGKHRGVRTFHIERHGKGDGPHAVRIEKHGKGKGPHRFRIEKGGPGEHRLRAMIDGKHLADCGGGETLVDESAGDDKEKTKVVLCSPAGADPAARAERLEEALARINSNERISAEHKEKIAASLRAAIDRARTAR